MEIEFTMHRVKCAQRDETDIYQAYFVLPQSDAQEMDLVQIFEKLEKEQ